MENLIWLRILNTKNLPTKDSFNGGHTATIHCMSNSSQASYDLATDWLEIMLFRENDTNKNSVIL